jgi:hypothetical protein
MIEISIEILRLGSDQVDKQQRIGKFGEGNSRDRKRKNMLHCPNNNETKETLLKKGYEGAELYGAQLAEADEFTELLRVLMISKKYNLRPETAIKVLDNLNRIESGKW